MAGIRLSMLKRTLCDWKPHSIQCFDYIECGNDAHRLSVTVRSSFALLNHKYHSTLKSETIATTYSGTACTEPLAAKNYYKTKPLTAFSLMSSNSRLQNSVRLSMSNILCNYRSYSSSSGNKVGDYRDVGVKAMSSTDEGNVNTASILGGDWQDKVKDAYQSAVDAVSFSGQRAKEVSNEWTPYIDQLLDAHPYLKNVIVPVSCTLTASVLAWVVMPKVLRRFHKYATSGPAALLSGSLLGEPIPYEKTFWGALEDPVRYLSTFIAFTQIGMMVAPTSIASQYVMQAWRGAVIVSLVWFLYRWKTNVLTRALATKTVAGFDRERLLALDKLSSIGLFVLGLMAFAEACGVAVQSILTVGGIGGVATAFAAKDVLGNVLSGLVMQFSKPFSIGDTIKAGSIEGQVVEMGLTTTSLLSAEKFPVIVPNSLFSSQVITNKSRAQWRAMTTKIPLQVDDFSKIAQIGEDIKSMLRSNPNVFLEKEAPYCFLSRVDSLFSELTLGYNLKHMKKDKLYATEQEILLGSVQIIKEHGVSLGSTFSGNGSG